jgi:hypothetical protein
MFIMQMKFRQKNILSGPITPFSMEIWCILLSFLAVILGLQRVSGQDIKRKTYYPIYTFQKDSSTINGVSVGLWSYNSKPRFTNTNGIKLELIGVGIGIPLIPSSPIAQTDSEYVSLAAQPLSEQINGLNLSASGTVCHCLTNGITAGFMGQIHQQVNGITVAGLVNFVQKQNGIMVASINEAYYLNGVQLSFWSNSADYIKGLQISLFSNISTKTKGVQLGLFNTTKEFKGVQIGLWNVNPKRKLPLINWNFR